MNIVIPALLWALLLGALPAQTLVAIHPLSDGNPASNDSPFGCTLEPDGTTLVVPLAGELLPFSEPVANSSLYNNDQVLRVDIRTGAVLSQATAGLFPEDVAFTRDGLGNIRHYFVTNSTDGTVTVLDAAFVPLTAIPLTPCFGSNFFSTFAFSLAASPDSSRIAVTALGCGVIDIIDADPASPTFLSVTSIPVGGSFGRVVWLDQHTVATPHNTCDANFTWCLGGLLVLDIQNPSGFQSVPEGPPVSFVYDSGTDIALLPDGRVLMTIGFGSSPRLVEFGPDASGIWSKTRSLDLGIAVGNGLHGLAVSPSGDLAVATSTTSLSELAFIDVPTLSLLSVYATSTGPSTLPNDVVFTPDGTRCIVTLQGSQELLVLGDLPGAQLSLTAPSTIPAGAPLAFTMNGVEQGRDAVLFVSLAGAGPQVFGPIVVELSDPFFEFAHLTGDIDGQASTSFTVPNTAAVIGVTAFWQAAMVGSTSTLSLSPGVAVTVL